MKVLVTCPPMIKRIEHYRDLFKQRNWDFVCPQFQQVMKESELLEIVPQYDAWIIGDDPATEKVFAAGAKGRLKVAVKWGVGTDNVDFKGAESHHIPIVNTPGVFGNEVADVALGYLLMLARHLHVIDREVRTGNWHKPTGESLSGKRVGLVGYGDIGRQVAQRLMGFSMPTIVYDPAVKAGMAAPSPLIEFAPWGERLGELDYLIFTCSLNPKNFHMLDQEMLTKCKPKIKIINVARGPLIDEPALIAAIESGQVAAAALDVFEQEPLFQGSPLHQFKNVILGSHNASNTAEAVDRVSHLALQKLQDLLAEKGAL